MTIPVVMFTGFLGAGKTTLVNWLLSRHADRKISVILNEFGSIQLESQFITNKTGEVIELANGCMCCVARSDIPRTIALILEKSPMTEYILIEASGLSDPDPLLAAFQDPSVASRVHLECVVGVVDAVNYLTTRQQFPIVTSQLADADLVVITKSSSASSVQLESVLGAVNALDPHLRTIIFQEDTPADFFLGYGTKQRSQDTSHHHLHTDMQVYEYQTDKELDLMLLTQLLRRLPTTIVRAKGVVFTSDGGGRHKVLVSHVGMRTTYDEGSIDPEDSSLSSLLFLGTVIDKESLQDQLDTCRRNQG